MEEHDLNNLKKYVEELAEATRSGRVQWQRANPSTYVWAKTEGGLPVGRITIQQISRKVQRTVLVGGGRKIVVEERRSFVLQVLDVQKQAEVLTVNSDEEQQLKPVLQGLFDSILSSSAAGGIDFLGSLLKP